MVSSTCSRVLCRGSLSAVVCTLPHSVFCVVPTLQGTLVDAGADADAGAGAGAGVGSDPVLAELLQLGVQVGCMGAMRCPHVLIRMLTCMVCMCARETAESTTPRSWCWRW